MRFRKVPRGLAELTRHSLLRDALALCLFEASFYVAYRYGMSFSHAASAPFWFPDAVLLCALLQIRARWWWLPLVASLPIRLTVAIPPETPLWFLLSTAAIDSAKAMLSAALLRRFLADPFRFATVRDFGVFSLVAVLLAPALSAFGGAAARHALGHPYWLAWQQWFSGDVLAALILAPIMFYWLMRPPLGAARLSRARWLEAGVLAAGLLVSISLAFEPRPERLGFADSRFYIPIVFLVWAALRFGMHGASAAAAALSCLAVAAALSGAGPFAHSSPGDTAAALQEFLLLRVAPLYLVAVLIEQTRRAEHSLRESEHSLRESEQRFRQVADMAPALIWMTAADGRCEFFNRGLLNFTGRTAGQAGDPRLSSIHGDDRQRCFAAYRASSEARHPYEMEYRMRRYDGADRWMLDRGVPRYSANGEFLGYVGCAIDVTDRRVNESALKQSEERYREVVESQTDFVCRFLPDTTLTFVNEAYCRHLGCKRDDLLGTKLRETLSGRTRETALGCIEQSALRGEPTTWECEVTLADGTPGWQLWICHAIPGRDGAAQEFQAIGHDITDRKRAEEANRSLAHTARLAALGEFTAMVAHEISQPLCAILGNAEAAEQLLKADKPPLGELRDIVADIRDADLRADEAIRSIRALTQKREMQIGPLDLNATVADILRLIAGDALHRRVHIRQDLAPELPTVLGDRASVEQVLLNLLSNGMDAMRDTPEPERQLTVQTRGKGSDYAEVTVMDRGHGISAEQMKHLFDSFFTTKPQGVGLGLSIARSIVQMHQGRIWADNCTEGGAAFHFTLRCAP